MNLEARLRFLEKMPQFDQSQFDAEMLKMLRADENLRTWVAGLLQKSQLGGSLRSRSVKGEFPTSLPDLEFEFRCFLQEARPRAYFVALLRMADDSRVTQAGVLLSSEGASGVTEA